MGGLTLKVDCQSPGFEIRAADAQGLLQRHLKIEGPHIKFQPAFGDPGEIQQIVNQPRFQAQILTHGFQFTSAHPRANRLRALSEDAAKSTGVSGVRSS